MKTNSVNSTLRNIGTGIGVGIIAGLAGTAAITVSQMIEMKLTGRKPNTGPANAVGKTLHVHADPGNKKRLSTKIHWTYGTMLGIMRGLLGISGAGKIAATSAHFVAVTSAGMAMAPLEGQNPVTKWSAKQVSVDIIHHAVYAIVTGLVFDAIYKKED